MSKRGQLKVEGKTKRLFEWLDDSGSVIPGVFLVESKPDITANDDPNLTQEIETKPVWATTTTCRVFELLQRNGIPVAYQGQVSDTEFLVMDCSMIFLEVVARRDAVGSYLKRHPELAMSEGSNPHCFKRPEIEFFLKTTRGSLVLTDGTVIVQGLDPKAGEEDPFIHNPYNSVSVWRLYHPKRPFEDPQACLNVEVQASLIASPHQMSKMSGLTEKVFTILEDAWAGMEMRLIDMKIEFGIDAQGQLLVADVIDNDSWRLKDRGGDDNSKQSFRDGESLSEVGRKYAKVAAMSEKL